MLCLCGKPTNGSWHCVQDPSCGFSCPKGEEWLCDRAVKMFLATKQARPKCCPVTPESSERNPTKFKVDLAPGRGILTPCGIEYIFRDFGRPSFECPKGEDGCGYFEWGDVPLVDVPRCQHGAPCLKVWEEGPNKGRGSISCPEFMENSCSFFHWLEPEDCVQDLDGEEVKAEFVRLDEEYPCPIPSWFERERERHMKRFKVIDGDDMI